MMMMMMTIMMVIIIIVMAVVVMVDEIKIAWSNTFYPWNFKREVTAADKEVKMKG
jgi:hypothetical protein